MKELKKCKDCKYCYVLIGHKLCSCPKHLTEINYATGKKESKYTYCAILRSGGWLNSLINGTCGRRARFFKKKGGENE